jgi:hypothetical protein
MGFLCRGMPGCTCIYVEFKNKDEQYRVKNEN